MSEAVAEKAEPALHDVGADSRRNEPGKQCGDQCALHEWIGQDFDHGSIAPPSRLSEPLS